jgi:long-subunit acyl-CoA synthetase (AMP-forming)
VIGDGRPYNTALIVLDPDYAPAWQARTGGDVRAAVQEAIDRANANLSRPEQIKRWTLLEEDWAPGGDELTPTMKLKRRPIHDKYAAQIDAMY